MFIDLIAWVMPMDARKLSKRTRRALADLPPAKRARAKAALTRIQPAEYQKTEGTDRAVLDHECQPSETIAPAPVSEAFLEFIRSLRKARESAGLTLDEVASRSGIDKAQLSRLENGKVHDPRRSTLSRYALAIGKRLALSLEDVETP